MTITVLHGDSRELLKALADASIDSVVCDPPYALVSITKRWSGEGPPPREGVYRRSTAGFMGKAWDTGETAFDPAFWSEVLRVMKPGAHLIAFGGTRTYHRLVCAIEDAGFEIRDQLAWLFGSGFPKSHNQHGEWEGWGTALKPAQEPICLARKPLGSTVAECLSKHGTGALNIDACRVEGGEGGGREGEASAARRYTDDGSTSFAATPGPRGGDAKGRWPANVIHDGSPEVLAGFPQSDGQQRAVGPQNGAKASVNTYGDYGPREQFEPRGDSGSAARFFYTPQQTEEDLWTLDLASYVGKPLSLQSVHVVSALERAATGSMAASETTRCVVQAPNTNASAQELRTLCESVTIATQFIGKRYLQGSLPEKHSLTLNHASIAVTREQTGTTTITISHWKSNGSAEPVTFSITETNTVAGGRGSARRFHYTPKADKADRCLSKHPTVKPVDLMAYLIKLVTPPKGVVLDPFAGSGSTGMAAMREGFDCILMEREAEYVADINRRLTHVHGDDLPLYARAATKDQTDLFGGDA